MIIPMFFTLLRIFIAPFLFQAICNHAWHYAAFLFFIGAISDFCDGFFARYLQQESLLGAALDPVADKLFLMTTLYALSLQVSYIPWYVVVFMMIKEAALIIGAGVALFIIPKFKIKPLRSAKVITACECIFIFIMLCAQMHLISISETILYWCAYICLMGNVSVFVEYSLNLYAQLKDNRA